MRRVTEEPGCIEIEMDLMQPLVPRTEPDTSQDSFSVSDPRPTKKRLSLIGSQTLLSDFETAPVTTVDSFTDKAKNFTEETKASFSGRDTSLSVAGVVPTVFKELGHHVPGLGAVLATAFLGDDVNHLKVLHHRIIELNQLITLYWPGHPRPRLTSFERSATQDNLLQNTMLYAAYQLDRRFNKLAASAIGRTFQVAGSTLTFAGLFTHGVTVIPGIALGVTGTAIKLPAILRSTFNNIQKRVAKTLSVNREAHARYLYGLSLLHLDRIGLCNIGYCPSREAKKSVQFVQNLADHGPELEKAAYQLVTLLIPPESRTPDKFLEHGLWSIMVGIKS